MNEVRTMEDEESLLSVGENTILPDKRSITLDNVAFRYTQHSPFVLQGINLFIPENKVTAIIGESGCGKSTLLKLLVRLYQPSFGEVKLGDMNMNAVNLRQWRRMCGVVMQDGKLFYDTIINNIVLDDEHIDKENLVKCCQIAQIKKLMPCLKDSRR